MSDPLKVGGIIKLKVDSMQCRAKGSFTYGIGGTKREGIPGHGYKDVPINSFIEGVITDTYDTDIIYLKDIKNATVMLELANGKTLIGRNMFYAGDPQGTTEEGEFNIRLEGIEELEVIE